MIVKKIIRVSLISILLSCIAFFYLLFYGNPVTKYIAMYKAGSYLHEKYGLEFTSIYADYNFENETYSVETYVKGEEKPNRIWKGVTECRFGILKFDFKTHKITIQMRGKDNIVQQE